MNSKRDGIVLLIFAAAIIFASSAILARLKAEEFRIGKPLIDQTGDFYVLEVQYGDGHYFVACFDKPEELASFTKLGSVTRVLSAR